MFNIIRKELTPQEAETEYRNSHIVLLYPKDSDDDTHGDVIYVGDLEGAWNFTDSAEPPEGYAFYMLRGINLRELAPIEVF